MSDGDMVEAVAVEQAVMACPQCEGEGEYADGLDEAACHTECTRCGGNGWIVDRAALSVIEGRERWQPIATAPKDGTWVLLCGGSINYGWDGETQPGAVTGQCTTHLNGQAVEEHWQFAWYDGGYYGEYVAPTHWRPLPSPPIRSGDEG